jgi:hypothetical protein
MRGGHRDFLSRRGAVEPARQAEIIRSMWQEKAPVTDLASLIVALQQAGTVRF